MGIHLADQTISFLLACLLGAALGALYDVFRVCRIAFPCGKGIVFAQDVVFFLLCAVTTFIFLLTASSGAIRVFLLIGELIGATLYYLTLGRLVMKAAKAFIAAVQRALHFFARRICLPVWRFVFGVVSAVLRPLRFFVRFIRKSLQRLKFRLKMNRVVLYNHLVGVLWKKKPSKRRKKTPMQRKKKVRKSFVFRLCVLVFFIYASATLIDMQMTLAQRKQDLDTLAENYEAQRLANKELERQLDAGVDDQYIERVARDKLNYVYPDERVLIDLSGS